MGIAAYGRNEYASALIELHTLAERGHIWTRIYPENLDYLGHGVARHYTEIPKPWHDIAKRRNGVPHVQNEEGVTEDYVERFGWYNLQTPAKGKTTCWIIR